MCGEVSTDGLNDLNSLSSARGNLGPCLLSPGRRVDKMDHNTQMHSHKTGNNLHAGSAPHVLHSTKSKMEIGCVRVRPTGMHVITVLAHTGTDEKTSHSMTNL